MRLIELRLKNLNSLKGEWHIDFSNAAFINEGIFAITGQTGAGKTTILDAICLALYGETPRINSISKSSNEVMTRQTADCFAEVVIDLNGSHYRCRWGQHRARGDANGNLQDATHEIAKLNLIDPSKKADILSSSLKSTKLKIIELTRMDFQQFTRSILLAQGSFSAFLKAKSDERADILEKITGTDIYATISEHVHEKKRFEEEILNKLQFGLDGLTLLDNEQEAELKQTLKAKQTAQNEQQQTLTQLSEQINWLDTVSELQQKLMIYDNELKTAQQAQQDFIPEAMRLDAANKALELDSHYSQLTYHRDRTTNLSDEQHALSHTIATQQADFEQAAVKLTIANKLSEHSNNALQLTLPILAQVRVLDTDINQQTHSLTDNTLRKDNLTINSEQLTQEIDSHKLLQAASSEQLASIDAFLNTHHKLNDLESDIATFESHCSRLKALLQDNVSLATDSLSAKQQANQLQVALKQFNEQQAANKAAMVETRLQLEALQQQRAQLIADKPLSQMRVEQEQIDDINNTIEQISFKMQRVIELDQQSRKIETALPITSKEMAASSSLIVENETLIAETKSKRLDRQTYLNLLRQVASLEDYIVELQDNHPCPLCGATEHPYAKHHPILKDSKDKINNDEQSITAQTQQQIDELDKQIDALQQTLSTQQIERATQQNHNDQQQQQLTLIQAQIKTVTAEIHNILASLTDVSMSDNKQNTSTDTADTISAIISPLKHLKTDAVDANFINNIQSVVNTIKQQLARQKQQLKSTLTQYEAMTESQAIISKTIENAQQQRFVQASEKSEIETAIKLNQQQLASFEKTINSNFAELQALDADVLIIINKYPAISYAAYVNEVLDISEQLQALKNTIDTQSIFSETHLEQHLHHLRQQRGFLLQLKTVFNTKKDEQQTLKTTLSNVQTQIETKQVQLDNEKNDLHKLSQIVDDKKFALKQLQQQRDEKLAGIDNKNPDVEEQRLRDLLEQAKNQQIAAQRSHDNAAQRLAQLQDSQQKLVAQIQSATTTLHAQQSDFALALARSQFATEHSFVAARLPLDARNSLNVQQQHIDNALQQASAALNQTQQILTEKQANPLTLDNREMLVDKQQQVQVDNNRLLETIGAMSQQLKDNNDKKDNQHTQLASIASQKDKLQVWQQLHKLIGSADGKKYRTFAQGLTFDIMVSHANAKLHKMSDRYLLIRDDNNALELNVIDNYQGGEIRSTKNLSGGEGFIISLALALGLSQMASHNIRVDSLFLDEGFGTLDEESLDIALDTLTSLQQEGKLIGVISHVAALKERILTQIQVTKLSGGFSQISGQGCQQIAN